MTDFLTCRDGSAHSRFCFGTMQFGGKADHAASRALYDACRAAGINSFDTAYVYTDGLSERWLGEMIRNERDAVFVATKCAAVDGAGRAAILAQFDESRSRLGLDEVDALYLHRWDPETPLEETFETLAELRQAGKLRYVGVSNFAAWQVMKAQRVAESFGLRIDMCQPMYNLVKRQVEVEILPMAIDQRIAVLPYSPLGGGLLTGKYAGGGAEGRLRDVEFYAKRYAPAWMHETAIALTALAAETGIAAATLAVAWVARHPGVTAPIISARNVEQLAPSLAAMEMDLDDTLYARISALSPAPPPATDRLEEI